MTGCQSEGHKYSFLCTHNCITSTTSMAVLGNGCNAPGGLEKIAQLSGGETPGDIPVT